MMLSNKMKRILIPALLIVGALAWWLLNRPSAVVGQVAVNSRASDDIGEYLKSEMAEHDIPGLAVVVIEDGATIYKAGLGLANVAQKLPVSSETTFELASNTKAFTALALHKLESEGRVELGRSVSDYLPGFGMKFNGAPATITVEQLLHHTSGIPFESVELFEPAEDDQALIRDVMKLNELALVHAPGSKFLYATINYDVLGAVIAQVSGMSYEDYVEQAVLRSLGLAHTSFSVGETQAAGYKRHFGGSQQFDAPRYRGNAPAGYLSTSINDVERWLSFQLGSIRPEQFDAALIQRAQQPDRTVKPSPDGGSYASGWWLMQERGGEYQHSGSNPSFSTYLLFRPEEKRAIGILANINTTNVENLAKNINLMLQGQEPLPTQADQFDAVDTISIVLVGFMLPFTLLNVGFLIYALIETRRKARRFESSGSNALIKIGVAGLFLAGVLICINALPKVFFGGVTWDVVLVWAPETLPLAMATLVAGVVAFASHTVYTMLFPKANDRQIFVISALGAITGLGNTFCIFTINMALQSPNPFESQLYVLFLFGMVLYVMGQKVVRTSVLHLTHNTVFEMRMGLVRRILNAPYHHIEKIEREKIQTVLNNDSELVSQFPHFLIVIITSATTLLFCFIYLGSVSLWGLLLSLAVIVSATMLFFVAGASANRHLEKSRTIQEHFFRFINDLTAGLKELTLSRDKKTHFHNDMNDSGRSYRDSNINAGIKFINVMVMGELLFTVVVGFVAFVYPLIFTSMNAADVATFVLVFLYMAGPVNGILNNIPHLMQIKVAWGRVQAMTGALEQLKLDQIVQADTGSRSQKVEIALRDVEYEYYRDGDDDAKRQPSFVVGPITCQFASGEITFITGGNGSGKSTLAKLITGLYVPSSGHITVNNYSVTAGELNQLYTAIFWDYHLFGKLYGVNHSERREKITEHLDSLELSKLVSIEGGEVSSTKLSTGQRKRLALLVSHLDERQIYLFDEWAADQDPEYRRIFYLVILPELKRQNKCVVVISHDDQYFDVADRLIKMEMGKASVVAASRGRHHAAELKPRGMEPATS